MGRAGTIRQWGEIQEPRRHMKRNYPLLLASQFLSAFGDNAVLAVILGQLTVMSRKGLITETMLRERSALYTLLLFIPYILLAPLAGYFNDRYPKTMWLVGGNAIKLLGTGLCALSIWLGYIWQAPGYFIVGIGSCFYGPAKYGILPEVVPTERLVKANGTVELLTLVAIITGMGAGAAMVDNLSLPSCYTLLLAIFGSSLLLNMMMVHTPSNPGVRLSNSVGEFFSHTRDLMISPRLARVLIGTALFWICGAAMKINFQPWGLKVLNLPSNLDVSLLGVWLSVGVIIGSVLAGQWHRVGDLGWTRRYGFLLVLMLGVIGTVEPFEFWRSVTFTLKGHLMYPLVMLLLCGAGFAAGLFLIPLNAALQSESDPARLGKTIAVQNLFDNIGMLLAGGLLVVCANAGRWFGAPITPGQVFYVLAGLVTVVLLWLRIPSRTHPLPDHPRSGATS